MDTKENSNIENRIYAKLTTPNGDNRILIRRYHATKILCCFSFSLQAKMPFVDDIDKLDYVDVDEVASIDEDLSYIILHCSGDTKLAAERLIDDMTELIDKHNLGGL